MKKLVKDVFWNAQGRTNLAMQAIWIMLTNW